MCALLCALAGTPLAGAEPSAEGIRFVVYGGTEGTGDEARGVVAQIVKLHPDLVAHAGGMVGTPNVPDWVAFHRIADPVTSLCPYYGCRGKHEKRALVLARNGSPEPRILGDNYFSFDYRGAHFVFLDTELPLYKDDPQSRWLDQDLASAAGKPIFAFTHKAVFGAAERFVLHLGHYWWHPIFARHKVRVVFSGARHLYHRLYQDGVAYVVTGGGGGPLDPILARRQIAPRDVAGTFNHCIEVTLGGDEIRCRAIDLQGKTRDEFAVRASGSLGPTDP